MNKIGVRVLKAIEEEDLLGITSPILSKELKISPKPLQQILLELEKYKLVEERHFPDGKVDYSITRKGLVYLRKLK